MAKILDALKTVAQQPWYKEWRNPEWKQYIVTGDEKHLKLLPKMKDTWVPTEFSKIFPNNPDCADEELIRFLRACVSTGVYDAISTFIAKCLKEPEGSPGNFHKAITVVNQTGISKLELARLIATKTGLLGADANPTCLGQYLLDLDKELFLELYAQEGKNACAEPIAKLFVAHGLEKWKLLLQRLLKTKYVSELAACTWTLPLQVKAPHEFIELANEAFAKNKGNFLQFQIGAALYQVVPSRFAKSMEDTSLSLLKGSKGRAEVGFDCTESSLWLINNVGVRSVEFLKEYIAAEFSPERRQLTNYKATVLREGASKLGRAALPLFSACFDTNEPELLLLALELWSEMKESCDREAVAAYLRQVLKDQEPSNLSKAVRMTSAFWIEDVENELWPLLSHKSRPVRDAAATTLAKLGDSRLSKTKELWAIRRADARLATVAWLKALATPGAACELKARLDQEEDDNVRDAILLALENISGNSTMSFDEIRERIRITLDKIKPDPVSWLDVKKLPRPQLQDGSKIPSDWLLYLIYRQSRVKDMRADIEAKPLYAQIDRKTSGDLALAVVESFFGSKADADDRWAMAFAALLGDDRVVPVLARQIKEWANNMRGKLAEYAVQALALLGTDTALLTVDAMAIRYRSKNKNIGKAASEAFAEAARARGLTIEELGDLVVPWLGFDPGKPRVLETAKAKIEIRLGDDFKLQYRDLATNKKVAKLPDSVGPEIKTEFKELSAGLKEAVKSQLLRMETLMVRQFRWPAARWQELYLQHPLLLPFAHRLVWGMYNKENRIVGTFRALEDCSLTDVADEPFVISEALAGIVHPLELSPEERQSWVTHFADYDVVPPFAQLERPVVKVDPGQIALKYGTEFAGTGINAMTFKGRAERLGWSRGSVCDAGCINYYVKSFPAGGVDVFIETEGMYVGVDMYSDINLGKVFFVKHGSVRIGSYEYDEPGKETDPRLVPFSEVPAIAFSEAMGDLVKISGKNSEKAPNSKED